MICPVVMTHGSVATVVTFHWSVNFLCCHLLLLITTWPATAARDTECWDRSQLSISIPSLSSLSLSWHPPQCCRAMVLKAVLAMLHFHAAILEASSLTTQLAHSSSAWRSRPRLLPPFAIQSPLQPSHPWILLAKLCSFSHPSHFSLFYSCFRNAFAPWVLSACPRNTFQVGVSSANTAEVSPPASGVPSSQPP